jgi:hypothetical protein
LAIITLTKATPELDRTGQAGVISGASAHAGPDSKESAVAPEHEIEITPEMIEAGIDALDPTTIINLRDGWVRPSFVAKKVFFAMLLASK